MAKPIVAVVGRPNVGKSTFFNKICGERISIVDDVPGVTRDRIYADAEWAGRNFTMIDTGGLDPKSEDVFQKEIALQADVAIEMADVIVMLVDGKSGITLADEMLAKKLRKISTPVVLVVNKLDRFEVADTFEFYALGLGQPMPLSCEQSKGIGDVLDEIVAHFPPKNESEDEDGILKIAIVGRPNVGKSSIINRLLGEKRVVVSDVEGTTRDSVMVPFKFNKQKYYLVDTAGLRRARGVEKQSVEGYSVLRTMRAIEKADVVVMVVEAGSKLTEQDVRIAGYVHEQGKPSIIAINKIDVFEGDRQEIIKMLDRDLAFMDYYIPVFVSALKGTKMGDIMPNVLRAYENGAKRIKTGVLNEMLADALLNFEPQAKGGRKAKIKYITQASTLPPTFVLFANDAKLINVTYLRYLENRFRERVDFSGTPLKFVVKSKEEE